MRKLLSLAALASVGVILTAGTASAQTDSSAMAAPTTKGGDMTNVPKSRQDQQRDFENGAYPFPAKKKNNWSVGLQVGVPFIGGDLSPRVTPFAPAWGVGVNVRKAFGHAFSLRLATNYGRAFGVSSTVQSKQLAQFNDATNGNNDTAANYYKNGEAFFQNHRTTVWDGRLEGVFHVNNVNFYRKQTKWGIYGFAGVGGAFYSTRVNALNGSERYDFSAEKLSAERTGDSALSSREIRKAVIGKLDDSYETLGTGSKNANDSTKTGFLDNFNWRYQWTAGAGLTYRASRRIDIALEHRISWLNDDLLDGRQYTAIANNRILNTTDFDNYNFTSLGVNVRIGPGEESLWWTNPLDMIYEQVAENTKKINDATTDTDGDGVADIFDNQKDSPAGAIVDAHGVERDDDGDGIVNRLDKEPFSDLSDATPRSGQVGPDGIALQKSYNDPNAPIDPNDPMSPYNPNSTFSSALRAALGPGGSMAGAGGGGNWFLPIIHFDLDRSEIKAEYYPELFQVAQVMRNNTNMKVVVTGHTDIRASEGYNMGLSQRRAQSAIEHLVRKYSIGRDRLVIESKGETAVLVENLPDSYVPSKERAQGVNRRVEFRVQTSGATGGMNGDGSNR